MGLITPVWESTRDFLILLVISGAAWWWAVTLAWRGRGSLALVLMGAVLFRGMALSTWPDLSDDLYRYAWEGELVSEGVSPYAFAPSAPELEALRTERAGIFSAMNNTDVSAAYPPLTQAACAAVVSLAHQFDWSALFSLRLFFTLCDLLVIWPLLVLARRLGLPDGLSVAWAWSPLVVLEFAGSGHFDSLGILLLLGGLALISSSERVRGLLGACLLGGAIVVKYLPFAALPFVARERSGRARALLAIAIAAASFLPLVWMTGGFHGLFRGMGAYGLQWQSSGLVHPFVAEFVEGFFDKDESLFDARRVTRALLAGVWFVVLAIVWIRKLDPVHSVGILLATFLVLSPTLHPWYVTWIVPFVALRPRAAWMWLIFAVPFYYEILEGWKTEGVWEQSSLTRAFVGLPLLVIWAVEIWMGRRVEATT